MTDYQLTRPGERGLDRARAAPARPEARRSANGDAAVRAASLEQPSPALPVSADRGSAWLTSIQRSAGNQAAAHVIARTRTLRELRGSLSPAGAAQTGVVVQRGGPQPITRADQQIEIDLHPGSKAAGQPKAPGWRSLSLKGGTQIVYILADSRTGEVLKVGKSTRRSFKSRFGEYVSAGNKWGRSLKITMFTLRRRSSKSIGMFEAEIRAGMERAGHRLPWDNTGNRLGRIGRGIPVPKDLTGVALIDQVEANAAAAAKAPPAPPRTPIASGPAPRTPIASGPSVRTPTASGPSVTPRPPTATGSVTSPPKATTPKATGRVSGGRMAGTGIKVLGVIGSLGTLEELRRTFAGLGPQVDLEGLDPGDFEVGFRITEISVGGGYYIDVVVERNIIFRRKFFVVRSYEFA